MQPRKLGGGSFRSKKAKTTGRVVPSYSVEIQRCVLFLKNFVDEFGNHKYVQRLEQIIDRKSKEMVIEMDDLNYVTFPQ